MKYLIFTPSCKDCPFELKTEEYTDSAGEKRIINHFRNRCFSIDEKTKNTFYAFYCRLRNATCCADIIDNNISHE